MTKCNRGEHPGRLNRYPELAPKQSAFRCHFSVLSTEPKLNIFAAIFGKPLAKTELCLAANGRAWR
jgi:hypothetical protein